MQLLHTYAWCFSWQQSLAVYRPFNSEAVKIPRFLFLFIAQRQVVGICVIITYNIHNNTHTTHLSSPIYPLSLISKQQWFMFSWQFIDLQVRWIDRLKLMLEICWQIMIHITIYLDHMGFSLLIIII